MSEFPSVPGYCPMGCGQTLIAAADGYITCTHLQCPCPEAVSTLLEDSETEHVVEFKAAEFTVRHPLRERLDDDLFDCDLHAHIAALPGPPVQPGRYRATPRPTDLGYTWQWIELIDVPGGAA